MNQFKFDTRKVVPMLSDLAIEVCRLTYQGKSATQISEETNQLSPQRCIQVRNKALRQLKIAGVKQLQQLSSQELESLLETTTTVATYNFYYEAVRQKKEWQLSIWQNIPIEHRQLIALWVNRRTSVYLFKKHHPEIDMKELSRIVKETKNKLEVLQTPQAYSLWDLCRTTPARVLCSPNN